MGCASVYGGGDYCWHIPFGLWVCVNGLTSLGHELYIMMHPFQAPHHLADGLVSGRFDKVHWVEMMHHGVCLCSWI